MTPNREEFQKYENLACQFPGSHFPAMHVSEIPVGSFFAPMTDNSPLNPYHGTYYKVSATEFCSFGNGPSPIGEIIAGRIMHVIGRVDKESMQEIDS